MQPENADAVYRIYRTASTELFESPEDRETLRRRTPEEVENRTARYGHLLRHDPEGAWVAEADGRRPPPMRPSKRGRGVAATGPL